VLVVTLIAPYAPLVHDVLFARVQSVPFLLVTYEAGKMCLGDPIKPATVRTGPLSSGFTIGRDKRRLRLDREEWRWELRLKFDREVSLEHFEASLAQEPPRVIRDADHDQQVTLMLEDSEYINPPQNQPATGTEAVYRFNAELTPS
jgi:hypothetical protein